jgi:hypothetical protein
LVNGTIGEIIVFDIFTALLSIISVCALFGGITKKILRPTKVWDTEDWTHGEIEEFSEYKEIRKDNPHIWME